MEQEQLISVAQYLATHIITELKNEYDKTEAGNLINEEVWCVNDFDELVHDFIKEYDYLNNDILSNMKTGPFETDGTDTVRDMIYKILNGYCELEQKSAVSKNRDGKIDMLHFSHILDTTIEKNGLFYQKLRKLIEDFV
tara:strand:+ start:967 stop:1383 length:417 start_codon:yes stop_codon:yes gene_type:complete